MGDRLAWQGWADVWQGARRMPLAIWLANEDMRARYARTALGPLWSVIGTGAMVFGIGLTFGVIMRQPMNEFLPYIAASVSIWGCIAGMVQDAPSAFVRNAGIISVYSLPMSIHAYRSVVDKIVLLFHSLLIYVALMAMFQRMPGVEVFLLLPALALYFVGGLGVSLWLGVVGARFRDLAPALGATMTMLFILTPIFWRKEAVVDHPWIADLNPFYHLLEIGRGPLLGYLPTETNWIVSVAVSFGALVIGLLVFSAGRRTTLFWI